MSFYDNEASWAAPARQASWEQQPPPSRSGAGSAMSQQQSETNAFAAQFEEIDRATDNLMKSGKWFPGQMQPAASAASAGPPSRRDSMTAAGRGYEGYGSDPRMGGGPSRQQSVSSEQESARPGSAGLQGYYAGQRFPGGRQSEAEQMLQSKRRMAAQRERELRNYHQEQQYNRTAVTGAKTDRSMSPNTMSEEDRRELIARQHRALYGDNSQLYGTEGSGSRPQSQDARVSGASAGRGPSPLAFDPYAAHAQSGAEGVVQMPPRDRAASTASPASNPPTQQSFALLSDAQHSSRTSNSSPGGSPPLTQGGRKGSVAGVAPIGTRPIQSSGAGPAGGLNKRSTTPLAPSSLSYGYTSADAQGAAHAKDERSTSSASNPPLADKGVSGLGGWGSNSAVWGSGKNTLAVQPSVWG
ncbi:hypothetical protein LTR36_008095 [Oleoguttula mirabilis]|uniref:Uncharacterized protein n=1 Tax=Oleoguttula mirabilis TaxID=1507867 RepID=A0AAV9J8Y0_9PEZI|nr:hypothetical protein LTR36_008095 [Oleoguttula mirabilis]